MEAQERGFPLRLVAQDKLGYKCAKWIVRIELSDDPSCRGYSNGSDLKNRTAPEPNPAPARVERGAGSSDIAN